MPASGMPIYILVYSIRTLHKSGGDLEVLAVVCIHIYIMCRINYLLFYIISYF